jgi:ferredoxin-NADP reductase
LWPAVAIWSFDRFLRLVRQAYCNLRVKFNRDVRGTTKTIATYNSDSDVITLQVLPASSLLKPAAGQHYYIYQPLSWKGWENHPFTLGGWSSTSSAPESRSSSGSPVGKDIEQGVIHAKNATTANTRGLDHSSGDRSLTFWIRPFDGWTRSLRDKCKASPDGQISPGLFIEGPYGHSEPLHSFEALLLISGGTGVAAVLPYVQEHIERVQSGSTTRTKTIHFVFAARQAAYVKQIYQNSWQEASKYEGMTAELYATQKSVSDPEPESKVSKELTPISPISVDSVGSEVWHNNGMPDIHHRRPDIMASVLEFAKSCQAQGLREAAVMVCGPAGMADEARLAIMKAGRKVVHLNYFEESFGW